MQNASSSQNIFYEYEKRCQPSAMANAHFHKNHELYFLEKGNTIHFVEDQIYSMNDGDMIFVPKGIFHKTDNKNTKYIERHLFMFNDEDFDNPEIYSHIEELKEVNYIKFPPNQLHHITDIARKMAYEETHQREGYVKMQKLYLQQLLILISRLRLKDATPCTNELQQIIQKIMHYINTNVSADLSLQTLATKYNLSPNYLSKQFKNVTDIGLSEYINIARISAAEKLLINSHMPITQVALECGFNDSNYFARVFKKLRGVTPKKYSLQK